MPVPTPARAAALSLTLLLAAAPAVLALKSDRDRPVVVDADDIEIDFETGLRTYTGNVTVRQGSLLIRGDKVVMHYRDEVLEKAIAYGRPARFRQRPEGKDEDVHGSARRMVLDEVRHKIHLYEDAVVTQGKNTVRSPVIHYDTQTSKVLVQGRPRAGGATPGGKPEGRARIIIQPKGGQAP